MEDDDVDFTPSPNTSSNLDSLFGFNKKPLPGNHSLTYTAPKAPKREPSPIKNQLNNNNFNEKTVIISKNVYSFKLENKAYVSQGLTGIAICGNHSSGIYDIVLYKTNKKYISYTRVSKNFSIIVSPNNYASFYDNNKQNWSVMFETPLHIENFALMVAICKFFSNKREEIVIQDLTPSSNLKATSNSIVNVSYSCKKLDSGITTDITEDVKEKINLSTCNFDPLKEGLIGSSENSIRVIIVPHFKSGIFISKLDNNSDLMLKVTIEKILEELDTIPLNSQLMEISENLADSSAEESSIKARGVSIKEALTNTKSQKANLISRMARMGQATLPLKQGVGLSDSEEENIISPPKPRMSRNRVAGNNSHPPVAQSSQVQRPETQQLSIYQNDSVWHQSQLTKSGVTYQQLVPVSSNPMSPPSTDSNMSVYVSESRIQAVELRMGISKVSEKLDLVLHSLQTLNFGGTENKTQQTNIVDPNGILSNIKALIGENETLKSKVEELKGKVEQQNDRIFQLLELNHKYLERNSTTHDEQSENEFKLKKEIESLIKKETELEEDNRKVSEKMKFLEKELRKTETMKKELTESNKELNMKMEELKQNFNQSENLKREEMEKYEEKMSKASEAVTKLKERLKEVLLENEKLNSAMKAQKEEIEESKKETKNSELKSEEYEKELEGLKQRISEEENVTESKIESLTNVMSKLEEENKLLGMKLEEKNRECIEMPIKILSKLKERLLDSKQYSLSEILSEIQKCFEEVAGVSLIFEEDVRKAVVRLSGNPEQRSGSPEEKSPFELKSQEENDSKVESEEKKLIDDEVKVTPLSFDDEGKEKEKREAENSTKENDRRYKSYDQGWRTAKPPPPFLFDDEEEDDDWLN